MKKAKICGKFIKLIILILLIGVVFYSFVWIPSKNYQLNYQLGIVSKLKTERTCDALARQELVKATAQAVENDDQISDEQKQVYLNNTYDQCLYFEGWYTPALAAEEEVVDTEKII